MTQEIQLQSGRYHLSRTRDGAGDSGHRLVSINPETAKLEGEMGLIKVGNCCLCGSIYTRVFGQDFCLTTHVTEILEVNDDKTYVKFKTGNSVYEVTVR